MPTTKKNQRSPWMKPNILKLYFSYFLAFLGFIILSSPLWVRFFRNRVIYEIPDMFLTEFRFWILIYICCIYTYVIKSLLIPKNTVSIFAEVISKINQILFFPLKALDRFIKYNVIIKPYYFLLIKTISKLLTAHYHEKLILLFDIFPRIVLVFILLLDTFWFNKIEIFYKCLLLALIPFLFKYYKYSLQEIQEQYIQELTSKYNFVYIFEEDYEYDFDRKSETEAIWHYTKLSIRKYIEIKIENYFLWLDDKVSYEYVGDPYCREEVYKQYKIDRNITKITTEGYTYLKRDFHDYMEQILKWSLHLYAFHNFLEEKYLKNIKIILFALYLTCWLYILCISYYYNPIQLEVLETLLKILKTIKICENPF